MIHSFKHKGLERFFVRGSTAGIQASHGHRLRLILGRLNVAEDSHDMDLPGLYLHRLKGSKKRKASARWSVRVSANWRVTFSFSGRDVVEVDYEDYH
ncbi:MAG: type II toxin-antitoxin system RelE/ParE family toxin [Pseudomonadales bacterium]